MRIPRVVLALSLVVAVCHGSCIQAIAQTTPFDLGGNGGVGLLPGNEAGANTATADNSDAFGGETGDGFVFDAATNTLDFSFSFEGLTGGLFDAAGGIHLHLPTEPGDPFNQTGGIEFFLNNGMDANVTLSTPPIAIGATSGSLAGSISFADKMDVIDDLFAGEIYLNIHSGEFRGGELRGTLIPIPEPTTAAMLLIASAIGLVRKR